MILSASRALAGLLVVVGCLAGCTASPRTLELADQSEHAVTQTGTASAVEPKTSTAVTQGCVIEKFTVHSASMNREIKVAVMLPPSYNTNAAARFPALYALHGSKAPYATFLEMEPLRKSLKEHPMLVIAFDGDPNGWYIDSPIRKDNQFTTFFFDELIPYIDGHYRTRADGRSRAVTGFSMGGYGALNYMLIHPEMFASVSSLSGSFDSFGERTLHARYLRRLLGPFPENVGFYLQHGIFNRLAVLVEKGTPLPPLYLHCGTDDFLLSENRDLVSFLMQENRDLKSRKLPPITFQYKESPGAHNWPFWRDASETMMEFHWHYFQNANAEPESAATKPAATKP